MTRTHDKVKILKRQETPEAQVTTAFLAPFVPSRFLWREIYISRVDIHIVARDDPGPDWEFDAQTEANCRTSRRR
jgi:hypothetical protein